MCATYAVADVREILWDDADGICDSRIAAYDFGYFEGDD